MIYLEDYLDTVEALPLDLQRNMSLMRELESDAQDAVAAMGTVATLFRDKVGEASLPEREGMLDQIKCAFEKGLAHAQEKMALAVQTYEMVDRHIMRLDEDLTKFEENFNTKASSTPHSSTLASDLAGRSDKFMKDAGKPSAKRRKPGTTPSMNEAVVAAATASDASGAAANKKRRTTQGQTPDSGKAKRVTSLPTTLALASAGQTCSVAAPRGTAGAFYNPPSATSAATASLSQPPRGPPTGGPMSMPIDPNEPTYCYCKQVSFGEMVACDNENCDIEWFHYGCVNLKAPPKGKWYCNECMAKRKKGYLKILGRDK